MFSPAAHARAHLPRQRVTKTPTDCGDVVGAAVGILIDTVRACFFCRRSIIAARFAVIVGFTAVLFLLCGSAQLLFFLFPVEADGLFESGLNPVSRTVSRAVNVSRGGLNGLTIVTCTTLRDGSIKVSWTAGFLMGRGCQIGNVY